jgi:hypothetical protein
VDDVIGAAHELQRFRPQQAVGVGDEGDAVLNCGPDPEFRG